MTEKCSNQDSLINRQENINNRQNFSDNSSQMKAIHKNKYIKKLKDILPQITFDPLQAKQSMEGNESQGKSMNKKQRNKHSAKQSRDRKKLYIEALEQKQRLLIKQLEGRKKQLQQTKNYLERVNNQSKTMSGFTTGRHEMMKKLEGLLEEAQKGGDPTQQINNTIDRLRYRIGPTGKERISTINQYFRQIVNLSLPALHRYMMWSAAENKHFFNQYPQEHDQWFQELLDSLQLSKQQIHSIREKRSFLKHQKQLLQQLINELKEVKEEIQQKSIELEEVIDELRQILTPIQCAHFILFIQKNKYRKELNLCQANFAEEDNSVKKQ